MFEINIPENNERTLDDILKHLAKTVEICQRLDIAKQAKESVDMVVAYINQETSYSDALHNIYEICDGLGMKGITIGSVVVDLNDAREIIDERA